ncbi:MAG: TetR/AcrR family transcriptional regulator [Myxococcota bacterium]
MALAAFDVVRARGTHNVTMSDLAVALGMKRPTLYWYFRDLGHVFDTVLEHVLERQRSFLVERLAAVAHPVDQLLAYADAIDAFFDAEGAMLISLVSFWGVSEADQPSRVIEQAMRHFLPLRAMAVGLLERGIEAGTVEPCDAAGIVDLVAVTVDGYLLHRVVRGLRWVEVRKVLWDRVLAPLKRAEAA